MKRTTVFFTLFIFTFLTFRQVNAQETRQPDPERIAAWQSFKAEQGADWTIRWDARTGLPRTIAHGKTNVYEGPPETAVRAFFAEQSALFGMKSDLADLEHIKTTENKYGLRRVSFQQIYEGVPVEGAEYKVHLFKDGRIGMANGFYYSDIEVSVSPSFNSSQAMDAAKSDLELDSPSGESHSAELVVFPTRDESFALAWKTLVFAEEPFTDWLYFIDARSGEVLEKQNRIMDAIKSPGLTDLERVKEKDSRDADAMPFVTGTGKAYPTHPGISSVSTKNFYRLNGNGSLQGTYAYVLNDDGAEAYSAGHDFQYSTGSTHFDEANLYYHVDNFRHNFIAGLGSLGFTQITAHAHAYNPYYGDLNAWFSAGNQHIYFGDAASSGSYNNFAREDKIVYHEYGHAVIYDIQSGISSSSTEEGAISEGTPDYFAGSFTGRSVIGDYAAPSSQRDMSDPDIGTLLQYEYVRDNVAPIGSVTPHTGGEFFSSILWDIRNSAGISAGQTDYLVFEALDGITGNPNFLDFRDAMMAADNAAYSGAHNDLIQNTFANKGIGNSTAQPPSVSISGHDRLIAGHGGQYTANVSNGVPPFDYAWLKDSNPVGSNSSTYNVSTSPSDTYPIVLSVTVTDDNDDTDVGNKTIYIDPPFLFSMSNNYPNPFNPTTQIEYTLTEDSEVSIKVYNVMGQEVATMVNNTMSAGTHQATFDAGNLSSGIYFAKINAVSSSGETFSRELKMQLVK